MWVVTILLNSLLKRHVNLKVLDGQKDDQHLVLATVCKVCCNFVLKELTGT